MNIDKVWLDYRSAIRGFLAARVSDAADVDDLLQEIMIKTHNNLHTVNSHSNIQSWLYTITKNVIADFYRAKAKVNTVSDDKLQDIAEEHEDDSYRALSGCVERFIRALPPESSELLMAIDIQGQPQKEYAEQRGVAYSTLKSRVQKARTQLRKLFDNCCYFSLDKQGNIIDFTKKPDCC